MAEVKLVRGTIGGVTVQTSEKIAERLGARFERSTEGDSATDGYDGMKVAELKAEIERRNEGRNEADRIPGDGRKPDLIAALQLDDDARAEQ